jgi:predicted proteasome-type protease
MPGIKSSDPLSDALNGLCIHYDELQALAQQRIEEKKKYFHATREEWWKNVLAHSEVFFYIANPWDTPERYRKWFRKRRTPRS